MAASETDILIKEMESIKKLLVLQTLANGYRQKDVAATLGVSEATLSRMLPKDLLKASGKKMG